MKMMVLFVSMLFSACGETSSVDLLPKSSLKERFSFERVEECLIQAREILHKNRETIIYLEQFLLDPQTTYGDLRDRITVGEVYDNGFQSDNSLGFPRDILSKFDGGWKGKWLDLEVEHIWFSKQWNVQFVIVSDDGVMQPAINYLDPGTGAICGIVETPFGERLHEGVYDAAAQNDGRAFLKWMIPDQVFLEYVEDDRYHIIQFLQEGDQAIEGVSTTYERMRTDPQDLPVYSMPQS